jgi:hypothetical protein
MSETADGEAADAGLGDRAGVLALRYGWRHSPPCKL